ncbi:hypothetical protein MHK_009165 [Candidatus Magnetomorum sp. HK-1]|nr:hypothetical protein MHK_009165 [Candidatus Magnetomorum sp. HK-1]
MLKLCHNCSSYLPAIEHSISNKGEQLLCSSCGQDHTIYPSGLMISSFVNLLHSVQNLSTRGFWVLKKNVFSVAEFFKLNKNDFLNFKNCGIKTADELVRHQKTVYDKLYTDDSNTKIPNALKDDNDFHEMIIAKFTSKKIHSIFNYYQIDSMNKLTELDCHNCFNLKDFGHYAQNDIIRIQDLIKQISNVIHSHPELKSLAFKDIVKKNSKIRDLMGTGILITPDNLPYSLNNWILGIANHSKRNKDIFMKKFGMTGCPKTTYSHHEGEQFKFATPFLEYLNTFPVWQKMGLTIKGNNVYLDESNLIKSNPPCKLDPPI